MIPLNSYEGLTSRLNVICPKRLNRCLVGLLFADPGHDLTKKELIPFINRFNLRSQDFTHFFFAGYVVERETHLYRDCVFVTAGPGGLKWYFSAKAFENIRRDFETITKWQFSGGVDLVLVDAIRQQSEWGTTKFILNFDEAVSINLIAARDDKLIPSLSEFFEPLFRNAETPGQSPIYAVSDNQVRVICTSVAKALVKHFLSKEAVVEFEKSKVLAVRNLSRPGLFNA